MLKVWGRKNSSNVRKVLWCVEELALPYGQSGTHIGLRTKMKERERPK